MTRTEAAEYLHVYSQNYSPDDPSEELIDIVLDCIAFLSDEVAGLEEDLLATREEKSDA